MIMIDDQVPKIESVTPLYPPRTGKADIYIREGCLGCHSQMVRPSVPETERYGEYSKSGEYIYDRPFLWGSKRTGPDLHRVGASIRTAGTTTTWKNRKPLRPAPSCRLTLAAER